MWLPFVPTHYLHRLSLNVIRYQEGMTVGFVRATKAYVLPTVLDDVFRFRKAFLTADRVLRLIFSALSATSGTAVAVSSLRGSFNEVSVDCLGFQPSGYLSTTCPWGVLSFIESAANSLGVDGSFSETEVRGKITSERFVGITSTLA